MQKIDLDAMSIEDLAKLRDNAVVKLAEKVNARREELEAELVRLSIYGKGGKGGKGDKGGKAAAPEPKLHKENAREALKQPAKESKEGAAKAA